MRLTVTQQDTNRHTEACTSVDVSLGGEIVSGSDDYNVWKWSPSGEPLNKCVDEAEACVTVVKWMPGSGRKRGAEGASRDTIFVAFANGEFRIVAASSKKVEKRVENAHSGAITGIAFNPEGSTMITSGEDGLIKVWSSAAILRSTLASVGKCVYTLVWGSEQSDMGGECILYSTGGDLVVKPINPAVKKQQVWSAHGGSVVLCADWSRMTNLIVSGAEDGTYRVFDPYGRPLYASAAGEYPVTAVAFSNDGSAFAVGSFLSVRVCDHTGWTYCREQTKSGSVTSLSWTPDSTQIVMGGGNGAVMIAQLVDRKLYWMNYTVTLTEKRKLRVQDIRNDTVQELEQRDNIIKMSMGFGYLVVATTTQCSIYDTQRWGSPITFDVRDVIVSMLQNERVFMLADSTHGIQLYSYEGRQICSIKISPAIRPEQLAPNLIGLSRDTVAVRDPIDPKKVLFYDAINGKAHGDLTVTHHMEVQDITLSQYGAQSERKLAFIDKNRDLFLISVHKNLGTQKIGTMVADARWNDTTDTLAALADGRLVTWYYPSAVFVDRELMSKIKHVRDDVDEFGRTDSITDFVGTRVGVRRGSDGALLTFAVSPYPTLLFAHVSKQEWEGAVRLCRFLKEDSLWAILAALAVKQQELQTAEIAYGALDAVDKLRFMAAVKEIPTVEGRSAELALFQRRVDEAERILTQAGLWYRAISMHMSLHYWDRALQLAVEQKLHVDTVLAHRAKHLESIGRKETSDKFRQVSGKVTYDWKIVEEKIKEELQKEKQRAKPYKPSMK